MVCFVRYISTWKNTALDILKKKLVTKEFWEEKTMERNKKRENKWSKCHSVTNGCTENLFPNHCLI